MNQDKKILVVDDEISICDLLRITLEGEGFLVETALNDRECNRKLESFSPDLLILDIMLPGKSGFIICKEVTSDLKIPVILLTAKVGVDDKVLGLEMGADDYITKPFDARELLARVKALLRRVVPEGSDELEKNTVLQNRGMEIRVGSRQVFLDGQEMDLAAKEFELLLFLMKHKEQVFSRDALLEKVWGYDFAGDSRTVDVHVQRLRKKIAENQTDMQYIVTVFGVGYKMVSA